MLFFFRLVRLFWWDVAYLVFRAGGGFLGFGEVVLVLFRFCGCLFLVMDVSEFVGFLDIICFRVFLVGKERYIYFEFWYDRVVLF